MSSAASSCPVSVKTWLEGPGADRDQQRALGVAACLDRPVGCDPGEVSVSQLAQHGPRHLVGLGQERECCALFITVVVLGGCSPPG